MWCCRTNKEPVQRGRIRRLCCLFALLCTAAGLSAAGRPDAETAKAYFEIAQAYSDVTKYDKAAEFFQKAAKDPGHKNAAEYNLARVYGLQGDWKKARPILERQYAESPGNVLILKAYAYSLASTGKYDRAVEMYRKLYDGDKENPDSALSYARILVFTKRYDEAQTLIEELKVAFAETNEKKVLDELEEKIKKAKETPEKADSADSAAEPAAKPNAAKPDSDKPAAPEADPAATPTPDAPAKPDAAQPADGAEAASTAGTKFSGNAADKPSASGTAPAKSAVDTPATAVSDKDGETVKSAEKTGTQAENKNGVEKSGTKNK